MLLNEYSSCPAFLQFDWLIIKQDSTILPDGLNCLATLKMKVAHNCLKILKKTLESYENRENAFDKTREPLFFEKFSVFGHISEILTINRKP